MSKKHVTTSQLVVMAFLIALEIILTRFLSFQLPIARIGFGFLPVAMTAIMFGPVWAGLCYMVGDLLGMMLFPTAGYFPGFTLSAVLTGILYGLFLHNKEISYARCFFTAFIVLGCITLGLNTFWLHLITGKGFFILLPTRFAEALLMLIVQTFTIPLVWNKIFAKRHVIQVNMGA